MMHVVVPQALIDRGSPVRLVVSGGGSGGHTFPAVTVIRAARAALGGYGLHLDPYWVGSEGGIEKGIAEAENVPFTAIPTGKLRRARNPLAMLTAANIRDAGKVPAGVGEAISVVRNLKPDAVLCTGGYVSVPVGLAARLCHRPLLVHEQTVRVGLANRITMRGATRIALSAEPSMELLPERLRDRAVVTGNPLRPGLGDGDAAEAPKRLGWAGWTPSLPTVYVTGGSLGARQVNELVAEILPDLLRYANVFHQAGSQLVDEAAAMAERLPADVRPRYMVRGFVGEELADLLALADVVVARSGGGTVSELTAIGKPSVLIPLIPTGGNEQVRNAEHLAGNGAARVLIGEDATPARLAEELAGLLGDRARLTDMASRARSMGRPDAAAALTSEVLALCAATAS
ncbi:UDP-N-acetylglucosamine--N-acetylmuramyl-(pentapeptide) pyrophosphoryl-undecaprenol N-acetylglucosamine transferase [Actinoallomurus iriomotensis]|uniref:UDP-N-acetylglucosamine--N-acetylmuramyl-(pentapeptide) pyrophosphoryl-undecaprenol N-acetylglucosamine transferase n=1 Tax=Actinoallomurus iriomotensis TaxID=478107 RepID=A0A9W6RV75_9ACTN|nr:UDP-N-acetylglucosamine--N-acetylmuramyl-(pentapeptide) pyrophosphoryl-undecaprenol N-acetylglucosamine transferase [Actinoallomurus iriomotensis]GLY83216.1 UDP-N-acetylglucosamine--N-acetylmuramyl-(pentapeptide) pyrophosphoryl-undecaprenol N-acetylglucosamine transferase [Actinoallomurus iriomotensis]